MTKINPRLAYAPIAQEPKQLLKAIQGYEKEKLVSLEEACEPLHRILDELHENIITAMKNSRKPADGLSQDESASIHLYTMEWEEPDQSLYAVLNRALRTPQRQILRPWFKYLKLFLTALFKLPSTKGHLWRGVRDDLSEIYQKDGFHIWWSFSSCTSSLEVLQQPQFVGESGIRTLFCIEGISTGKNISRHSYFKKEDEILLLPGTSLQVRSVIHRQDGFHLVHLRQAKPPYELLVSPFDDESSQLNSSVPTQTSIQSRINPTRILKSKQYDSDDDSSADEAPNSSYRNSKFAQSMDKYSDIGENSSKISAKNISSIQSPINGKSESPRISKLQTQKSAEGSIEINYVDRMGSYIIVQNTSSSSKYDQNMTGWLIKKTIDNSKLIYEFPDNFILKIRTPVRIVARNTSKKLSSTTPKDGMIYLVADNIVTWGTGTNTITQLIDDEGKEQASYTQKFV